MVTALFDFDGTLVDSDAALAAPFLALGIDPARVPLGLPLGEACHLAGITVADYVTHYDETAVEPFDGVVDMLGALGRWGLCSNKQRAAGLAELARLRWSPAVALFSDDFGGRPKELGPVLRALDLRAQDAIFVGDTEHDRASAAAAGVRFALAGWNARAKALPGDLVLTHPSEVLALLH